MAIRARGEERGDKENHSSIEIITSKYKKEIMV
jgi:hypothetical protein